MNMEVIRRVTMELITIIVPVYNVEKYIKECVDSLISQTYQNIEIILVDDGSKDKSGVICDSYATLDSRIKVIHKQNEGLGFARNTGLKMAQGKFVTFIDSDDKADTDLVENLVDTIHEFDCDTCIGGFKRITEEGIVNFKEQYEDALFEKDDVYNELFARMLGSAPDRQDAIRMSVWNVLYSMDVIRQHNIEFPSERKLISEDIIWDAEYYKYARRVKVISSTAYNYRITPGSLTQKYRADMLEKICVLYNEMYSRISSNKILVARFQRQFFVNLRVCIKQEQQSISNKSDMEMRAAIKEIVNYHVVQNVSKAYLKIIRQKKQKLFVWAVRYKCVMLLYLINKIGLL